MRTSILLLAIASSAPAAETPIIQKLKDGAEALDAVAILVQRNPTSGDGKPGIFRMQGGGQGTYNVRDGRDDFEGSADFYLPIAEGRMVLRVAVPVLHYVANDDTDIGLGDLGLRWDWVPKLEGPNALLVEVDTTWDTAAPDELGIGTHTIAPAVAYAIPLGRNISIMPAVDHRLDWGQEDGADISLTRFHAYGTWSGDGRFWAQADLAMNINHEGDDSWTSIDVLGGMRLGKAMNVWARPGFALGDERPYDARLGGGVDFSF